MSKVWAWLKDNWHWAVIVVGGLGALIFTRPRKQRFLDDDGGYSTRVDQYNRETSREIDRGREALERANTDADVLEATTDRVIGIVHAARNDNERAKQLLAELRKRSGDTDDPEDMAPVGSGR